ncbi:MAG TPA: response regulator, partial [Pyrinomonadaceae bacterium]|nr:response regulator [Pyrinomonadaceae bacterium]
MENSGQRPTILIVEDIDWIRSAMRKAVEREGYRAVEARSDSEAFDCANLQPVDLILTEEEVPTFNELMARLSEHSTLRTVPVVIVNPDTEDDAR